MTPNLHIGAGAEMLRTKRAMAFLYGFAVAFIAITAFLAFFDPTASTPPQFPRSLFSYFFPNSTAHHNINNNTTTQISPHSLNSSNINNNAATEIPHSSTNQSHVEDAVAEPPVPSSTNQSHPVDAAVAEPPVPSSTNQSHVVDAAVAEPPLPSSTTASASKARVGIMVNGMRSNYTTSLLRKHHDIGDSELHKKQLSVEEELVQCDFYDGSWVRDESYPLYKPGSCSFIDEQFNCIVDGRPDTDFQKLRWKPHGCALPRLDAKCMLKRLKGKRLAFVGDSLNRNMWESLVCILKSAVKDPNKVYEAHGRHRFRTAEASYSFIFKDYDLAVDFFVSPFLVREWEIHDKDGHKKETLRLDLMGESAAKYNGADILIFNTGHWWTHEKTSKGDDYYQEGNHVYDKLHVKEAYRKAITTWAKWVDSNVNPLKTTVFFRGYSESHFSGGRWNSGGQCHNETEPIKNEKFLAKYPYKMRALEAVLRGMKTPVSYLNITRITDYRKDGHPSIYRKQKYSKKESKSPLRYQDCSHWCLPGVPDTWNELLYAELLVKDYQRQKLRS